MTGVTAELDKQLRDRRIEIATEAIKAERNKITVDFAKQKRWALSDDYNRRLAIAALSALGM